MVSAFVGGVIFNASNILFIRFSFHGGNGGSFSVGCWAGIGPGSFLSITFSAPKGNPLWLFVGVLLVVVAIVCNGMAAGKKQNSGTIGSRKGIVLATIAGVLMSFFYRFVASAMDLNNFISPTPGMATPYTAFFIFAGRNLFQLIFIFNTLVMKHPFCGSICYL